ncbi:MAG: hypothetical protein CVV27_11045 [Candidatus Melainabacteria bacterium HGW-Melainabacteria-1]|nr:MAG: hypothetical protein CVV27_11045 [Candidatus Melainabacteria bacterium HGW-Melainabacteria-1]
MPNIKPQIIVPPAEIQPQVIPVAVPERGLRPAELAAEPASQAVDSLLAPAAKGSAQLSLSLAADPAIEAWKQAAKGNKLALNADPKAALSHLKALMAYVKTSETLSPTQKSQIQSFLREFPAQLSPNDKLGQSRAIKLLNELLGKNGLTVEQLGLIADGSFKADDLIRLLRSNPENSLVGWNLGADIGTSEQQPLGQNLPDERQAARTMPADSSRAINSPLL